MKKLLFTLVAALLLAACTQESGKPFNELPEVSEDAIWSFFAALPSADLPAAIGNPAARQAYRQKFEEMKDGVLGDGAGPEADNRTADNSLYWSDYFARPDDYDWENEDPAAEHPYVNFHVYPGTKEGTLFGVLESGAYQSENETKQPDRGYWFDGAKVKSAPIVSEPPYTADNITPDPLLVYGNNSLHFSIKEGKFGPSYFDRGCEIFIEDVGTPGVEYEWNGVSFVRQEGIVQRCIYGSGFGNLTLGEDEVPWSIPGFSTKSVEINNPFEYVYTVTATGADEPTLFIHASEDQVINQIEVCSEKYANIYGIHPGSLVAELIEVKQYYDEMMGEDSYLSVVELPDGQIHIYTGFDEDYFYVIRKEDWLGDESFKADARIVRVGISNGVG